MYKEEINNRQQETQHRKGFTNVAAAAAMIDETVEGEAVAQLPHIRGRHIKKRALRNKSLSVSFNEKDLTDYVTGFHKRKKKRRREANQKLEEANRRKRIEGRKKRKLEREFALYGGAPPDTVDPDEGGEDNEEEEESEPVASVSGTMMYESGDVKVTVTTSEISHGEDDERPQGAVRRPVVGPEKKQNPTVSKKKVFKKVVKRGSQKRKTQSNRDRNKGKKKRKH